MRKVIAVTEIVGGAFGLFMLWTDVRSTSQSGTELAFSGIIAALYMIALTAGFLLWQGRKAGHVLSIVTQLVQLPKLVCAKAAFMVSFGLDFGLAVRSYGSDAHGVTLLLKLGAFHLFRGGNPDGSWLYGVSVTSCLFLWSLAERIANRVATILFWLLACTFLMICIAVLISQQIRQVSIVGIGAALIGVSCVALGAVIGVRTFRRRFLR